MSSVGTLSQINGLVQLLQQNQTTVNDLQTQISTGLKSQTFAGISGDVSRVTNLQSVVAQDQQFNNNITTTGTRLQTMNNALGDINSIITGFQQLLPDQAFDTSSGQDIRTRAKQALAGIMSDLNAQDGTRFVFAGSAYTTAPADTSGLPSPGDVTTNVAAAPPAGYYAGDSTVASAQIGPKLNVSYGITADNPAFEQAVRALNFIANLPAAPDPTNSTDVSNIDQATTLLQNASNGVQSLSVNLSLQQAQLTSAQAQNTNAISLAQGNISNLEQADPATVITQLNTMNTQLQASYSVISDLQRLSLVNFLH